MSDIFLSYASADRERVLKLVHAFEALGFDVWWDRDIAHGENYHRVIQQALERARCAVVVWTQTSVDSEWVVNEASEARRRNVLVPVLLDVVEPPLEFRHLQAASLANWNGDPGAEELQGLANAARRVIGRGPKAPPSIEAPPPNRPSMRSWWQTPAGWLVGAGALLAGLALLILALRTSTAVRSSVDSAASSLDSAAPRPTATAGVTTTDAAPPSSSSSTDLLGVDAGATIIAASEANWKSYVFGPKRPNCAIIAKGGFVTFVFRDERRARFDRLAIFVESTSDDNPKTIELYASDAEQGPFTLVGAFDVPNFRNERAPSHAFTFDGVTARYVRLVVKAFRFEWAPNGNVCTMELHGALVG